jgi:peptidoglycan L-alanyl-D-glutamate endopeptidase CwlK
MLKKLIAFFLRRGVSWTWQLPSFYEVPMGKYPDDLDDENITDIPEVDVSRDFQHANETLVERYKLLAKEFEEQNPGKRLIVTCTYRSPKEQNRLYKQGRFGNAGPILTYKDGKNSKSRHNFFPSTALDVAVVVGGKAVWAEEAYWPLLPLAKKYNLQSGGGWVRFADWPHLQLPKEDC